VLGCTAPIRVLMITNLDKRARPISARICFVYSAAYDTARFILDVVRCRIFRRPRALPLTLWLRRPRMQRLP
jgi:hypothetical protein